jgi:hypothetical protein
LKNKKFRNYDSFRWSEDVLTSTIFGNLRYFRNQNILIDFLNESVDLKKNKLNLGGKIKFEINFWEKHYNDKYRRYNETDLTISNNNYNIIIECKYRAQLSEENIKTKGNEIDYSNQLIRYSKILLDKKYINKTKIVIFLTDDPIIPKEILIKSKNGIKNCIGLYWLSWNKLYLTLMKQNVNRLLPSELLLYNDFVAFLVKRNLITFEKFVIENTVCNYHYRKQYRYVNKNFELQWNYKKYYNYVNVETKLIWRYRK